MRKLASLVLCMAVAACGAGVERAASARARCRACREPIEAGSFRVKQCFFGEDARFSPGGFIHLACAAEHFGTRDLLQRLLHFAEGLSSDDRLELERDLGGL